MVSIFSRIISGEIPGRLVWEDDTCVVMVDIRPLKRGHCLVIPKQEVDHWVDLEPDVASHLMAVASTVARAQSSTMDGKRIGLMIAGFEVPHTHIHITPIDSMRDLDFVNANSAVTDDELDDVAATLRAELRSAGYTSEVPE